MDFFSDNGSITQIIFTPIFRYHIKSMQRITCPLVVILTKEVKILKLSYSLHMSCKENKVCNIAKLGQISRHNLRSYQSNDNDQLPIQVIRGGTSIVEDVKRIYHEQFDEALAVYNKKQRPCRKINDYLTHVSNSSSDIACEFIIQVGDRDFWAGKTNTERLRMVAIFKDQLETLESLVPELKVASAVIHNEASPHMHIVGVPVADGYANGLSKQVSKTKIFTRLRLVSLQDKMREAMACSMRLEENRTLFDGYELKEKEPGRNKDIPKCALDDYYMLQDEENHLKYELRKLEDQTAELQKKHDMLSASINVLSGNYNNAVITTRFVDWSDMPASESFSAYRDRGELFALYEDGTTRTVGTNDYGGWDDVTLADEAAGRCRVGIIQDEGNVKVPESLFAEIADICRQSDQISPRLQNLINQQEELRLAHEIISAADFD